MAWPSEPRSATASPGVGCAAGNAATAAVAEARPVVAEPRMPAVACACHTGQCVEHPHPSVEDMRKAGAIRRLTGSPRPFRPVSRRFPACVRCRRAAPVAHRTRARSRDGVPFDTRRSSTRATPRDVSGRRGRISPHPKSVRSKRAMTASRDGDGEPRSNPAGAPVHRYGTWGVTASASSDRRSRRACACSSGAMLGSALGAIGAASPPGGLSRRRRATCSGV